MSPTLAADTGLVRISGPYGPVGAGFVVDDTHIVTCAHVINAALDLDLRAAERPQTLAGVEVHVRVARTWARVEVALDPDGWAPLTDDHRGDVAVLTMTPGRPADAGVVPLQRPDPAEDRLFRCQGFPTGTLMAAGGRIRAGTTIGEEWVQVEDDKQPGRALSAGFSGAPIWELSRAAVVGMATACDSADPEAKIGAMLPSPLLPDYWPPAAYLVPSRLAQDPKFDSYWDPRARGVENAGVPGTFFTGRRRALTELVAWLVADPDPGDNVRVITGGPGSGKSAVLARLVTASDPGYRHRQESDWDDKDPGRDLPAGAIDTAVYARGLDHVRIVQALATGLLDHATSDPDTLVTRLAAAGRPVSVVVDGLDEAADPIQAAGALRGLAQDTADLGVRLLIGTRPGAQQRFLQALGSGAAHPLDLDHPTYLDRTDLAGYVRRRLLLEGVPPDRRLVRDTPYRGQETLAERAAEAVAARAYPSFLIAALTAVALVRSTRVVDPAEEGWDRFPITVADAMAEYLDRFGADRDRVRDLLRPLAYAYGAGLSPDGLWAKLATGLAARPGRSYTVDDVGWLLDTAGDYLLEATTDTNRSRGLSYRLYHQALIDHIRDCDRTRPVPVEDEIYRQLLDTVHTLDGARDWPRAHPYLRIHLIGHAAATAHLDDLIDDHEFLQVADPATARQVVESIPAGHPNRAVYLSKLGVALRTRFERTGDFRDLDGAVDIARQVVESTPAGHPDRAVYLSDLGVALRTRFQHRGRVEDLDGAVDASQEAIEITTAGHPNRAVYLSNRGIVLRTRFERNGGFEDLDRAVDIARQVVESIPAGHPNHIMYLSNLGVALRTRFERTGRFEDLDRAVDIARQVMESTPAGHPNRIMYLSNLGVALRTQFERTGRFEDLDRAVDIARQVMESTPAEHPDRAVYLSDLGVALRTRFQHRGWVEDVDGAVDASKEALEITTHGHPNRALYLSNLGIVLRTRFERNGRVEDLDWAVELFRAATTEVSAPVDVRTTTAREWGRSAALAGQWTEAVEGFGTALDLALDLVGLVASPELARSDREFRLSQLTGLGSEAAAVCVQAGQPGRAAEMFEQGQGILFSQVLGVRSDLTDLERVNPELAEQFARWRDALDGPDPHPPEIPTKPGAPWMTAARRRVAAAEFERILSEIRTMPGFERFLAPPEVEDLLRAAAGGAVVLLNIAPLRSDALILTTRGVEVVPLGGVDPGAVAEQTSTFLDALTQVHDPAASAAIRTRAEAILGGVLGWMWDRITGPVLNHLGYTTPPEIAPWPRVWWCPSGALSLLPIYAAGHHDLAAGASDAVIDRVISSSIPTVNALLHARQTPPPAGEPRVLVVAMPHTPGRPDLPGAAQEAAALEHLLSGRVDVLGLPGTAPATYDTVTAALRHHAWVHFSCHSESDPTDPSASRLLLADYPLSVADLSAARIEDADLAFLSASTTARTGLTRLDEPIHLAAACQLAGYRHVVASLWPIADHDTARLTERFYTHLTTSATTTDAAAALHHATRRLRGNDNRVRPSHWAAYTHTGR